MKVLLDTPAMLVWWAEPDLFPAETLTLLSDPETTVLVSAISAYALVSSHHGNGLHLPRPLLEQFDEVIAAEHWTPLPVTSAHAQRAGELSPLLPDFFDALIAAQALVERVPLITQDPGFKTVAGLSLLW